MPVLQKFKSTCAPDGPVMPLPETPDVKHLTVADLKSKLKSLGEPTGGKKQDLEARLAEAAAKQESKEEGTVAVSPKEALESAAEGIGQQYCPLHSSQANETLWSA